LGNPTLIGNVLWSKNGQKSNECREKPKSPATVRSRKSSEGASEKKKIKLEGDREKNWKKLRITGGRVEMKRASHGRLSSDSPASKIGNNRNKFEKKGAEGIRKKGKEKSKKRPLLRSQLISRESYPNLKTASGM